MSPFPVPGVHFPSSRPASISFKTFHDVGLACVVGGMNIKTDMRELRASPPPDILVATPGRLNDHLENHGLAPSMRGLSFFVFDEADQASQNRDGCS